jgi:hypothetical protein
MPKQIKKRFARESKITDAWLAFSTARSQNVENQHEKEGPRFSGSLSLF